MKRVFYTKQGDNGTSRINKTKTISKTDPILVVLGGLDELNSFLGLVRTQRMSVRAKNAVRMIQGDLFVMQAHVASLMIADVRVTKEFPMTAVSRLEKETDELERIVKPEHKFVITGSNQASAWLDCGRAMSRRVERDMVRLCKTKHGKGISWIALAYANRLSSILYALARYEAKRKRIQEEHPTY